MFLVLKQQIGIKLDVLFNGEELLLISDTVLLIEKRTPSIFFLLSCINGVSYMHTWIFSFCNYHLHCKTPQNSQNSLAQKITLQFMQWDSFIVVVIFPTVAYNYSPLTFSLLSIHYFDLPDIGSIGSLNSYPEGHLLQHKSCWCWWLYGKTTEDRTRKLGVQWSERRQQRLDSAN